MEYRLSFALLAPVLSISELMFSLHACFSERLLQLGRQGALNHSLVLHSLHPSSLYLYLENYLYFLISFSILIEDVF